jgi:hypothetical protein
LSKCYFGMSSGLTAVFSRVISGGEFKTSSWCWGWLVGWFGEVLGDFGSALSRIADLNVAEEDFVEL